MKFVDLGLPSGTLWAERNEDNYYDFDEAVSKYGDSLPTLDQLEELKDQCKWEWMDDEYKVVGPNGNTIVLPAEGYLDCDGDVDDVNSYGYCWTSTPNKSNSAWYLYFGSMGVSMLRGRRCYGHSVRLIKKTRKVIER